MEGANTSKAASSSKAASVATSQAIPVLLSAGRSGNRPQQQHSRTVACPSGPAMEGANTSKAASVATSQATPTADRNMDEELLANKEKSADIAAQGPLEMEASSDEESSDAASNPGGATTVYESTAQGSDFEDPELGNLSVEDEQWLAACPKKTARQKTREKTGRNRRRAGKRVQEQTLKKWVPSHLRKHQST